MVPRIESILNAVADRKPKAEAQAKKTSANKPAAKPTKSKSKKTPAKKTKKSPVKTVTVNAAVAAEERK